MTDSSKTWVIIVAVVLLAAAAFAVLKPSAEAETTKGANGLAQPAAAAAAATAPATANQPRGTLANTAPAGAAPVALQPVADCLAAAQFKVEIRGADRIRISKGAFGPMIVWFFADATTANQNSPSPTWAPVNNTLVQGLSWAGPDPAPRAALSGCLGA
jgi:hypothetical protein